MQLSHVQSALEIGLVPWCKKQLGKPLLHAEHQPSNLCFIVQHSASDLIAQLMPVETGCEGLKARSHVRVELRKHLGISRGKTHVIQEAIE
jgi:hypothetical protein